LAAGAARPRRRGVSRQTAKGELMGTRRSRCWGTVYRPKGRDGKPTRWYWLKLKFPGDARPRRVPTEPRTDDEAEATRQLNERLGERDHVRRQRERVEDLT